MLRLLLTTFLLSLYSTVSSTSEYSKISEGWHSSSSLGSSATRGGRDRRTTHWESRSHSNLDDDRRRVDDDKDRGHSQIPYPLLGQQSSPLGFSASQVELTGRNTNEIDLSNDENFDNDSGLDHCITVIRNPILLVPFDGTRRNSDDMIDAHLNPTNSGSFGTIRCRRRIHGWKLQEPVYVEEPRWVFIDLNRHIGSAGHSMNDDDPFYVARGKRSLPLFDVIGRARSKTNTDYTDNLAPEENSSLGIEEKNVQTVFRRKKSNALGDVLRSSLLANQELGFPRFPTLGTDGGKGHAHGYVSPRNKHSDIMDILNEPFFISRGKKDSMKLKQFEWYNKYARKQMSNENFLPISVTRDRTTNFDNCDPREKNCFLESNGRENQVDPRFFNDPFAFRDRRGIMEDLLKDGDPFYLARGKRSSFSSVTKNSIDDSSQLWDSSNFAIVNDRPTSTTSRLQPSMENIHENLSIVH